MNTQYAFEGIEPKDEHTDYAADEWEQFERPRQVSTIAEFTAYVSRIRRVIDPPPTEDSSTADAMPEDTAHDEAVR